MRDASNRKQVGLFYRGRQKVIDKQVARYEAIINTNADSVLGGGGETRERRLSATCARLLAYAPANPKNSANMALSVRHSPLLSKQPGPPLLPSYSISSSYGPDSCSIKKKRPPMQLPCVAPVWFSHQIILYTSPSVSQDPRNQTVYTQPAFNETLLTECDVIGQLADLDAEPKWTTRPSPVASPLTR